MPPSGRLQTGSLLPDQVEDRFRRDRRGERVVIFSGGRRNVVW
jgi:hypothetical protein